MKKAAIFAAPNDTEIIPNYTFRFNRPSSWISCNSLFFFVLTSHFPISYFVLFVFPPLLRQVWAVPVGVSQGGGKSPWLRSLPTFCRITESRSPRGLSGGEERD